MAKSKKLTFSKARSIANKGIAKSVKFGKVQKPPKVNMPKFPSELAKRYKSRVKI